MILTAKVGNNADIFSNILQLYLPKGGLVLDMTYGTGAFWHRERRIAMDIRLVGIDALTADVHVRADFRQLPFASGVFDCVVFDPPYADLAAPNLRSPLRFGVGTRDNVLAPKSNKEVLALYASGFREARRILKPKGIFVVKCQDNGAYYNHVTMMDTRKLNGRYKIEDLFIMVQRGSLPIRGNAQHRARKNHSYFIVYRKV